MPEVKEHTIREIDVELIEGYKNIKPEHGTTPEHARAYVAGRFQKSGDTEKLDNTDTTKVYYDDNGDIYRRGNKLEPNKSFEINGYIYSTDKQGRTITAEGQLRLKQPDLKRNMDSMQDIGKGNQIEGDHRGHTIAFQFGGSGGLENLTAMSGELNRGDYLKMEIRLSKAVRAGSSVYLKVQMVYSGDSYRPVKYRVSYSIDGLRTTVTFRNEGGEKYD